MDVDPLLSLTMLLNFVLLASGRIGVCITAAALQGALLGLLPVVAGHHLDLRTILLVLVAIAVKGLLIPAWLRQALAKVQIRREVEPLIGFTASLLLGAIGTVFALVIGTSLPLASGHQGSLTVPAALATLFTGLIILVTRRKAITQVVGFLVFENGIYLFGILLVGQVPFLVETGVLLDLVAGIFVMGIVLNHIQREFASLDTRHLSALKE